jgi:hypothetical protein
MVNKKAVVSPAIVAKARKVLKWAEQRIKEAKDQIEMRDALYADGGMLPKTFLTPVERRAFFRTEEYAKIVDLILTLPTGNLNQIRELPAASDGKKSP